MEALCILWLSNENYIKCELSGGGSLYILWLGSEDVYIMAGQ